MQFPQISSPPSVNEAAGSSPAQPGSYPPSHSHSVLSAVATAFAGQLLQLPAPGAALYLPVPAQQPDPRSQGNQRRHDANSRQSTYARTRSNEHSGTRLSSLPTTRASITPDPGFSSKHSAHHPSHAPPHLPRRPCNCPPPVPPCTCLSSPQQPHVRPCVTLPPRHSRQRHACRAAAAAQGPALTCLAGRATSALPRGGALGGARGAAAGAGAR